MESVHEYGASRDYAPGEPRGRVGEGRAGECEVRVHTQHDGLGGGCDLRGLGIWRGREGRREGGRFVRYSLSFSSLVGRSILGFAVSLHHAKQKVQTKLY